MPKKTRYPVKCFDFERSEHSVKIVQNGYNYIANERMVWKKKQSVYVLKFETVSTVISMNPNCLPLA